MLIGELSRRTGVRPRLLRYYEERGLLAPGRDGNSYRGYGDDAVLTVGRIRALLDAGLSTEVIRSLLPCAYGDPMRLEPCPELLRTLHTEVAALDGRIEALDRARGLLAGYLPG